MVSRPGAAQLVRVIARKKPGGGTVVPQQVAGAARRHPLGLVPRRRGLEDTGRALDNDFAAVVGSLPYQTQIAETLLDARQGPFRAGARLASASLPERTTQVRHGTLGGSWSSRAQKLQVWRRTVQASSVSSSQFRKKSSNCSLQISLGFESFDNPSKLLNESLAAGLATIHLSLLAFGLLEATRRPGKMVQKLDDFHEQLEVLLVPWRSRPPRPTL